MSIAQTELDIYPVIENLWSFTEVAYPNATHDQNKEVYIRLNIAETTTITPCIAGNAKHERSFGEIVGSLFLPRGQTLYNGKTGSSIAEDFKNLLSQQRFGQTITFTGRVVDAGLSDDEAWYRYNVMIKYQTNIIKP